MISESGERDISLETFFRSAPSEPEDQTEFLKACIPFLGRLEENFAWKFLEEVLMLLHDPALALSAALCLPPGTARVWGEGINGQEIWLSVWKCLLTPYVLAADAGERGAWQPVQAEPFLINY